MRKILLSILAVSSGYAMAAGERSTFQQFDNQYNIGYGYNQMTLQNGAGTQSQVNSQTLNLEIERLFDMGIWIDVTSYMVVGQSTNQSGGLGGSGAPLSPGGQPLFTQNPFFGGINGKVGYSFDLVANHLELMPYLQVGWNQNLAQSVSYYNGFSNAANDAYMTAGVGARLEYRINKVVDLYVDQLFGYNWDYSGPNNNVMPQNLVNMTSTIGAKFNVVKNFQIGVNGFYTNYQQQASNPSDIALNPTTGNLGPAGYTVSVPQSTFGGMVNVGLTY